jgi:hypothetical protein
MTVWPKTFAFLAGCWLSMPFLAARENPAMLSLPADQKASCSGLGQVWGRDMMAQAFLLKKQAGDLEEIPFSRWTRFFEMPSNLKSGGPRAIDPTDIRLGDRVCVVLDTNQAIARLILVVEQEKAR